MPAGTKPTLRVVTGKGGVGKTVIATALAMAYAQSGYRTLIAEINGGNRVSTLLDSEPTGSTLHEIRDRLWVVDINPHDALHEYALLTLRFETLVNMVVENRFSQRFFRLVPSLNELVMLGKIWFHHQETLANGAPRFDCIIVDAPATGHAIALLQAAHSIIGSVPPGPLRDNAILIRNMLHDQQRSMMDVVTIAEEMPITETIELINACNTTLGMRLGNVVINQWLEPLPEGVVAALRKAPAAATLANAIRAVNIRMHKQTYAQHQCDRLPAHALQHAVHVPRVVTPDVDAHWIEQVAYHLTSLVPPMVTGSAI